ncbi:helix-turn-helix domain-containing protein [Pseudoflavonifractor phocaeensis]|uniref:helix-turn-helix domain-containing protein n=1 Tax=Pseudoflavonifractor phocaeensis TaxID=1870988 RepID=UPI00210A1C68|nr:helix-turn-helix domain-containing protein [Pseudoflavonifractor phocaeensis]MCQ4863987.1 helix-turn-helix domain-containing protein [Pseudoflavonifractor phocaeensis]
MYDFEQISFLLPFLSQALGPEAEILLCDTERILYAEHPITDRVKPGNRLGDMERSFLEEGTYKTRDSVVNYRALLPSRERLRASTLFLKNQDGSLAGFLTVNIRVESMLQARDMIDTLINGEHPHAGGFAPKHTKYAAEAPQPELLSRYEGVNVAIEDIIQSVTEDYLAHFGVPAGRLTTSERQQIVQELDRRGVFLVKGSIGEVAQRLGCSEVTIYRYLQQNT